MTNGGIIGPRNNVSRTTASGFFSLGDVVSSINKNSWPRSFSATGGTITESEGYRIHTFLSNGTFEVILDQGSKEIEYLIVAGGGGGGRYGGGGGGG